MGRNVNGLDLTDNEKDELAREWAIEDLMLDEKLILGGLLNSGKISEDYYWDRIDKLRKSAEEKYAAEFLSSASVSESFGFEESDWDGLQEYMESF